MSAAWPIWVLPNQYVWVLPDQYECCLIHISAAWSMWVHTTGLSSWLVGSECTQAQILHIVDFFSCQKNCWWKTIAHSGAISWFFFFFSEWLMNECKCRQNPPSETSSQRLLLDKAVVVVRKNESTDLNTHQHYLFCVETWISNWFFPGSGSP